MRAVTRFTDRSGGVSAPPYDELNLGLHVGDDPAAVAENRRRVSLHPVVWMDQVHGDRVELVAEPREQAVPATDAVVTSTPELVLAVMVADCVPVLLADETAGVVAAAHAGRRGLQAVIVLRTVEAMQRLGAEPARTRAVLGPAICGRCYEVPRAMQDEVAAAVPAARSTTRAGTPALDLRAGLRAQLEQAGVPDVVASEVCTAEDARHYSFRRDGVTGRFAGQVWLER